jgi:hypothetical protein
MEQNSGYLNARQAAEHLGISVKSLAMLVARGLLPLRHDHYDATGNSMFKSANVRQLVNHFSIVAYKRRQPN